MGKDLKEEPIIQKLVEVVKKQGEELKTLQEKMGKMTDAYCEGLKDGIAYAEKHKGDK